MDGWTAGADPGADPGFFVGGGGSRPDGQNTGSAHETRPYIHTYIHTHVQTGTYMFMHRQTDGHTCTCIDGKLKDKLFKTCIIMYRDNVRNIHVHACRGIHARVIIFKFPMKMNNLVPSRPTYFIFIGYLKTGVGGHGGGSSDPHEPILDPPLLIHVC